MRKLITSIFILLAAETVLMSQDTQDKINRQVFDKVMESFRGGADKAAGELTADIAAFLCGTPYAASTLEGDKEELRIFLDKTDCILFVESCICLALTAKGLRIVQDGTPLPSTPSYGLYCDNIRSMRYRNGIIDGYASRLHYTSEWLHQAAGNGILKEYTSVDGERIRQSFSFMSSNSGLYPSLSESPENVRLIRGSEMKLEAAGPYHMIAKDQLKDKSISGTIRRGDVIAFVSSTEGLDITHIAIAYPSDDGEMHFIHASSKAGKVIFEPTSLADYTRKGIRCARLTF